MNEPELVQLSALIEKGHSNQLVAIAKQERLKKSDIVRRAIAFFLASCPEIKTMTTSIETQIELNEPEPTAAAVN